MWDQKIGPSLDGSEPALGAALPPGVLKDAGLSQKNNEAEYVGSHRILFPGDIDGVSDHSAVAGDHTIQLWF